MPIIKMKIMRGFEVLFEQELKPNEKVYANRHGVYDEDAMKLLSEDLFLIEQAINSEAGMRCHIEMEVI